MARKGVIYRRGGMVVWRCDDQLVSTRSIYPTLTNEIMMNEGRRIAYTYLVDTMGVRGLPAHGSKASMLRYELCAYDVYILLRFHEALEKWCGCYLCMHATTERAGRQAIHSTV